MARPYSYDLRSRVATRLTQGRTCRETAAIFGISVATAVRIGQRFRQTGSAAAKPMGGVHRDVLAGHKEWLRARFAVVPDLTLRALQAELAERGVKVSCWAVWKFCRDERLSFKKNATTQRTRPPRHRPATTLLAPPDGVLAALPLAVRR